MYILAMGLILTLIASTEEAPGGAIAASGAAEVSGIPKLVSFENGNVGVNFLGFKASAGLGGLLTGNAAHGGLQASAETPFGQAAGAGLGGAVNGEGRSIGGLYAGATAGGGVGAEAGLAGDAGVEGSVGGGFAGASAGGSGVFTSKTKVTEVVSRPVEVEKEVEVVAPLVVQKHFEISSAPIVEKEVEIEQAKPQTTYVERTVIPNYVEKTIQVPSYVEKTIRVPTVVEKKIRVPAAPTVIEKTVAAPPANVEFEKSTVVQEVAPQPVTVVKTRFRSRPHHLHFRKLFNLGLGGGYGSGYGGGFGGGYGGYGGGYGGGFGGNQAASGSFTVAKAANTQLFNDIFNIPISTLGAVNKLVNGVIGGAGGASGSFAVSKSIGASSY